MTRVVALAFSVLMLCMFLATAGCSEATPGGVPVAGTVMVDGEPLSGAVITFEPKEGTGGPAASVPVFDGTFEVTADAGLHAGTFVVRVSLLPPEVRAALPGEQRSKCPPVNAVVAPRFDAKSTLQSRLEGGKTNTLEFEVRFL